MCADSRLVGRVYLESSATFSFPVGAKHGDRRCLSIALLSDGEMNIDGFNFIYVTVAITEGNPAVTNRLTSVYIYNGKYVHSFSM